MPVQKFFSRHFPLLLCALLGLAVYAPTLRGTFIYDDVGSIPEDKKITDPHQWGYIWSRDYYYNVDSGDGGVDNLYRPLVSTSYALQYYLHGPNPFPYHLFNILLYAACCALVARFAQILAPDKPAYPWIAGLLFAAHPIHVESVAAIVGRAELMALLGILGALTLHLSGPLSHRRTLGIIACMLLALFSKEQGMLVPALLLAAEPLRRQRQASTLPASLPSPESLDLRETVDYAAGPPDRPAPTPPGLVLTGSLCFLLAAYIFLREQILGLHFAWDRNQLDMAMQPMILAKGLDATLMPLLLLGRYTAQLFWPAFLTFDYSGAVIGWTVSRSDPYLYLGLASLLIALTALAFSLRTRSWRAFLLLVSLALTYGLIGNIVTLIGVNYAERLIFTPSLFFILLLALPLASLPTKIWSPLLTLLVLAGFLHTAITASRWTNRLALYEYLLAHEPRSVRLHTLVAFYYTQEGRYDDAARIMEGARNAMPQYWSIWVQSAQIEEKRDNWPKSMEFIQKALNLNRGPSIPALKELQESHTKKLQSTRPAL